MERCEISLYEDAILEFHCIHLTRKEMLKY
jgi:hypothetical protein